MHRWLIFAFSLRIDPQGHFLDAKIVTRFKVNVDRFIRQQNTRFGGTNNFHSGSLIGNHLQTTTGRSSIDQTVDFRQLYFKIDWLIQFHRALVSTIVHKLHRQPIGFSHHQSSRSNMRVGSDLDLQLAALDCSQFFGHLGVCLCRLACVRRRSNFQS